MSSPQNKIKYETYLDDDGNPYNPLDDEGNPIIAYDTFIGPERPETPRPQPGPDARNFIGPVQDPKSLPVTPRQGDRGRKDEGMIGFDRDMVHNWIADKASQLPRFLQKPAAIAGSFPADVAMTVLEMLGSPETPATMKAAGAAKGIRAAERSALEKRLDAISKDTTEFGPRPIKGLLPEHASRPADAIVTPGGTVIVNKPTPISAGAGIVKVDPDVAARTVADLPDAASIPARPLPPLEAPVPNPIPTVLDRMGVSPAENPPYPLNVVPRSLHPTNRFFERNVPAAIQDKVPARGIELQPLKPVEPKTVVLDTESITARPTPEYNGYTTSSAPVKGPIQRLRPEGLKPIVAPVVEEVAPLTPAEKINQIFERAAGMKKSSKSQVVTLKNPTAEDIAALRANGFEETARNQKSITFTQRLKNVVTNEKGAIGDQSGPKNLKELQPSLVRKDGTKLEAKTQEPKIILGNFRTQSKNKTLDLVEGLKRGRIDYKALKEDEIDNIYNTIQNETSPEILKENLNFFKVEKEWSTLHGTPDDVELAGSFYDAALDRARQLKSSGDSRFKNLMSNEKGSIGDQSGPKNLGELQNQESIIRKRLKQITSTPLDPEQSQNYLNDLFNKNTVASEAKGMNIPQKGSRLLKYNDIIDHDANAGRPFVYNPKTDGLVIGGPEAINHADVVTQAGFDNRAYDDFPVHGFFGDKGSNKVITRVIDRYGLDEKGRIKSDTFAKLAERLKAAGLKDDFILEDEFGRTKATLNDHLNKYIEDSNNVFPDRLRYLLDDETGAITLRGFKKPQVNQLKNEIFQDILDEGEVNIQKIMDKYRSSASGHQIFKILDDIGSSGELEKALAARVVPEEVQTLRGLGTQVIEKIKEHIVARGDQDSLVSAEKLRRIKNVNAENTPGTAGTYAKLRELRGEYPKVDVQTLKDAIDPAMVDETLKQIRSLPSRPGFDDWDKLNTEIAFQKIMGNLTTRGALQKNEIDLLANVFGKELTDELLELHGGLGLVVPKDLSKLKDGLLNAGQVLKGARSAGDIGWPLRQGITYAGRPSWARETGRSIRAYFSEGYANKRIEALKKDPLYEYMEKSGLDLTDFHGKNLERREENMPTDFFDRMAEKNLLGKIGAFLPKAGNRSATVGLDGLRATQFTNLYKKYGKAYEYMLKEAKADKLAGKMVDFAEIEKLNPDNPLIGAKIADIINTATGRGKIPDGIKGINRELNAFLFSPKMISSRLRLMYRLGPKQLINSDKVERMENLRQLMSILGTVGVVDGLTSLAGGDISKNITSPDFWKGKMGNTRIDPSGGFFSYIYPAFRIATGIATSSKGNMGYLGDYGQPDMNETLANGLAFNREAPLMSLASAIVTGQEFAGREANFGTLNPMENTATRNTIVPMLAQDLYDLAKESPELFNINNPGTSLALGAGSALGLGVNSYGSKIQKTKKPKPELLRLGPVEVPVNPDSMKRLKTLAPSSSMLSE